MDATRKATTMQVFTVLLTAFYVLWLAGVLVLLWTIWRNGVNRAKRLEEALIETSQIASKAAEAALLLAQKRDKDAQP